MAHPHTGAVGSAAIKKSGISTLLYKNPNGENLSYRLQENDLNDVFNFTFFVDTMTVNQEAFLTLVKAVRSSALQRKIWISRSGREWQADDW